MVTQNDAVIASYARTPIGKAQRSFKGATVDALLGPAIDAALKRAGIEPCQVEDAVFGNVLSQGAHTEARAVALSCGIPAATPVAIVNRQCGSGLDALDAIASKIRDGRISVGIAGGFELMSQNPIPTKFCVNGDALATVEARACLLSMGETAEILAKRFDISRIDADYFACESQAKAMAASANELWRDEIVPVFFNGRKVAEDDGIRETDLQKLAALRPAFGADGVCTAGNSSQLSDAAAALVLMSRARAEELHVSILATFVDFVCVGCDPAVMGIGPTVAVPKLLSRNGLAIDDIDVFEINEAFAVQALHCVQQLGIPESKVNLSGGAIALGHPLGCTGARLVATILSVMERRDLKTGVVALCVGTGMGVAALIRRD